MRIDFRQVLRHVLAVFGGAVAAASLFVSGVAVPHAQSSPVADNTLTAQERAAGWTLLFGGTTTTGWRAYQQKTAPAGWQAVNDELTLVAQGGDHTLARGAHVEHWLEGEKVVDYELWTPEWKALVAKSKFKEGPSYGLSKTGYIGLQDHGNAVAFKNIKIRVLK